MLPVKFPLMSVVTSVKGRVLTLILEGLPGTVPEGGLKSIVGKYCEKAGVAAGRVSNDPEPSDVKNRPKTVLVETPCTGTSQLTLTKLEFCPV